MKSWLTSTSIVMLKVPPSRERATYCRCQSIDVDALRCGRAEQITTSGEFRLHSTQFTMFEVAKYIPRLTGKLGCTELELFEAFEELPVIAHESSKYADRMKEATALIGARDERDVQMLALALTLEYPVWSDDRDFEGIAEIQLYKTSDLISRLATQS